MWCTLVETWYGVAIENKEALHPSNFISLGHNLRHQILHKLDIILFVGFIPLGTQVELRWLIRVSRFIYSLSHLIAAHWILFPVFDHGLMLPLDRLGCHWSIIGSVFAFLSSTKHVCVFLLSNWLFLSELFILIKNIMSSNISFLNNETHRKSNRLILLKESV